MSEFSVSQPEDEKKNTRQLLGMKGADPGETLIWKLRLQLMKPITWILLIWNIVCGAALSGGYCLDARKCPQNSRLYVAFRTIDG